MFYFEATLGLEQWKVVCPQHSLGQVESPGRISSLEPGLLHNLRAETNEK